MDKKEYEQIEEINIRNRLLAYIQDARTDNDIDDNMFVNDILCFISDSISDFISFK